MKYLLFIFLILSQLFGFSQTSETSVSDSDDYLKQQLSKMILSDNQYFFLPSSGELILFNIVPEESLKKKDSLRKESEYLNREILKTVGLAGKNKKIEIAFLGRLTDKNYISFSYVNSLSRGLTHYDFYDTLQTNDQDVRRRLENLNWSRFVRYSPVDSQYPIFKLKVITKNPESNIKTLRDYDAIGFLIDYLGNSYRKYSKLQIEYIDQYSRYRYLYEVNIDDLILDILNIHYGNLMRKKREERLSGSQREENRPSVHLERVN